MKYKVIISGAAGRDYSNYIVYFKNNPNFEVVAFTATQIPGIEKRKFPKELTYNKKDIPIYTESRLKELIKKLKVDYVFLSYSDLSNQEVLDFASRVLSAGANFSILGTKDTYVESKKPIIAVTAVRTGSGKSQVSRAVAEILRKKGKKVVAIRHAMPYGNLLNQTCQRFETEKDFQKYETTIEEEEEYQPWIDHGFVVYSGFDYKKIINEAEKEADIILFDGGNNDISFIKPDLNIVVADPHRPGHELTYYPGFVNFLIADVILINKVDSAKKENIEIVKKHAQQYNPKAKIILAKSDIIIDRPELLKNKKVLAVGDGPSLTHGNLKYGAATLAANKYNAHLVDPKHYSIGSLKEAYNKYSNLSFELPALGYSKKQVKELETTINKVKCDVVIDGTPANLKRIISVNKPIVEVNYELGEDAVKELEKIIKKIK